MIEEAGVAQTAEHPIRNREAESSILSASSSALVAHTAERFHGKEEVESSILSMGPDFEQVSRCCR